MRKKWYHFTARVRSPLRPFVHRRNALEFWLRIRGLFPTQTLAAVLMPNHLHLLIESARPAVDRRRLAVQMRAFTRAQFPGRKLWDPVSRPEAIGDLQKLERIVRYIHLNPCRAKLESNPWAWEFSTILDHSGVVPVGEPGLAPWVSPTLLDRAFGRRSWNWSSRHSDFILRDPFVSSLAQIESRSLSGLNQEQFLRALERALGVERSELFQRGVSKDWAVRVHRALYEPSLPLVKLAGVYGVGKDRCSHLAALKISASVQRFFEIHAGGVGDPASDPSKSEGLKWEV